jgi:hypothetical protein
MRLKPAGIVIILLVIGVLAYLAFKPRLTNTSEDTPTEVAKDASERGSGSSYEGTKGDAASDREAAAPSSSEAEPEGRKFNYTPQKPVNGTLRGVVEVGASGFNSFVIRKDDQKRWEIVSKDFGESLTYEGLATTEDIRTGLKKYLSAMFDKGVLKNDMHFVISSGAQKEPKTTLISNELKKFGYVVNLVSAAQEAQYAFKATVPPGYADNSFLVDIGSGNTKVSWEENGTLKTLELPGAKYYEKGKDDDQVYNEVKQQITQIPKGKRNVGFIIGGVPFTLAKQHRKGEERYTVLHAPQSYQAADKKMAAGLNIYQALADATRTDTFVFDWDANFTIGFLLGLKR